MENTMYTEIGTKLTTVLPDDWEKVCLYAQVTDNSYEFFFYVKVSGEYIQCYNLEKNYDITRNELRAVFKDLYEVVLPDQHEKNWYVLTFILDNSENFSVEYEYTNYVENSLGYKNTWKEKYLK